MFGLTLWIHLIIWKFVHVNFSPDTSLYVVYERGKGRKKKKKLKTCHNECVYFTHTSPATFVNSGHIITLFKTSLEDLLSHIIYILPLSRLPIKVPGVIKLTELGWAYFKTNGKTMVCGMFSQCAFNCSFNSIKVVKCFVLMYTICLMFQRPLVPDKGVFPQLHLWPTGVPEIQRLCFHPIPGGN